MPPVPAAALRAWFETLPDSVRMLVRDMAVAQQEQTDAVLAMLVKDAEARFADWLLRHAQTLDGGGMASANGVQFDVGLEIEEFRCLTPRVGVRPPHEFVTNQPDTKCFGHKSWD